MTRLMLAPLPTIVVAIAAVRALGFPRRLAALAILAEVCLGLFALGLTRSRANP